MVFFVREGYGGNFFYEMTQAFRQLYLTWEKNIDTVQAQGVLDDKLFTMKFSLNGLKNIRYFKGRKYLFAT